MVMGSKYASQTEVPIERSKTEIESILNKYGATGFGYLRDGDTYMIVFQVEGRRIRFVLPMPKYADFKYTDAGRLRSADSQSSAWEQAGRQKWRALVLVIKAKLEAVEAGIVTFEEEFLAHIMLPDGRTVGEWTRPQLEAVYSDGSMPALLPGGTKKES
jgi:hypothetical protein